MKIQPPGRATAIKVGVVIFSLLVVFSWLILTPPGILGKADAVGYAVCHRIPERSFTMADRQLPLCARCSGMYLGALVGYLYQFQLGRKQGMPPQNISIILFFFVAAFGLDGINSYFHFFPMLPTLYESMNWLRLLTGTGIGIGIAAVMVPVFHQTIWITGDPQPAIVNIRHLGIILALSAVGNLAMLSDNPFLLFPLAVLEAGTVIFTLGLIYTIVVVMLLKKENTFLSWMNLWPYLTTGFTIGIMQIGVMDFGRFIITGTWDGFKFGG